MDYLFPTLFTTAWSSFSCFICFFQLAVGGISILGLVGWILMIVDVARRDPKEYPPGGSDQRTMWILIIVLGSYIGALIYYLMIYRKMGPAKSK